MTQVVGELVPGFGTVQETFDDNGQLISAILDGGTNGYIIEDADRAVENDSGFDGNWSYENFDGGWNLTSARQLIVNNDGAQTTATEIYYGPNWTMTSASIYVTPDPGTPNWNLSDETGNLYDANWRLDGQHIQAGDSNGTTSQVSSSWSNDASGNSSNGAASWSFRGGSGSETWATGTHSFALTETANPGSAVPLDRLTDVAFDNSGAMTGAKILTYGIQGQAFTQTEEDYDASWHLTSWHGVGPNGYDQTVNYMV